MKRYALAISLFWFAASLNGCTKRSDQATAAGAQQSASDTSVPVAESSAGTSTEPTNATDQDQAYDSPLCTLQGDLTAARVGRSGPDARKQVAEALTEVADGKFGPGVIFASAAGAENGVLLLAATPENEKSLKYFGNKNVQTIRDRAQLCAEDGFRQVQLIVRQDDGVDQKLVKRVVLDYDEAKRYISQTTGARPVE